MEALGINLGFFIAQLINFAFIFAVLTAVLWKPLVSTMEKRRETIEKGLEDARVASEARKNAEAEAEKIKADARAEAQKIIAEARSRAEEVAKEVKAEAQEDATGVREEARTKAEGERDAMLADMRGQVVSLAMAAANKLIGESMNEKKQTELVNNFFSEAPAGVKGLSGDVTVTTALPLTDAEKTKVLNEIDVDEADFKVDPSILGGIIIRAGDKVVDGSVRSGLGSMAQRLN